MKRERIDSLDWLRGLMAVAVMTFHLGQWYLTEAPAGTIIGKLGVYAVSIFFVLSGLSMAVVYNAYIKNFKTSVNFFIRRIFRIWPLLAVVTILSAIIHPVYQNWSQITLNLSLLFGFVDTSQNIATGSWSIGNELVYYALTPFLIFAYNKNKTSGNLLWLLSILIGIVMTLRLDPQVSLDIQWSHYINPFTNLFFYTTGIAMYYNLGTRKLHPIATVTLLALSAVAFIFTPVLGGRIDLATGVNRLLFSFLSALIVYAFYSSSIKVPKVIGTPLTIIGLATYGIYLIHPLVAAFKLPFIESAFLTRFGIILMGGENYRYLAMGTTIILAVISFYLFENLFVKLGKRVTKSKIAIRKEDQL